MSWTDERVETLKTLLADGKSASQIAKELGGVTRNAVIGKIHRLGLSSRAQAAAAAASAAANAADAAKADAPPVAAQPMAAPLPIEAPPLVIKDPLKTIAPPPKREEHVAPVLHNPRTPPQPVNETSVDLTEVEKRALRLNLLQLTERTCKWPIGDPNDPDFHFCGLPALASKPYCASHAAAAYQPMSSRRDRERTRAAARLTAMN